MAVPYRETVFPIGTLVFGAMMGFTLAETGGGSEPQAGDYYVISSTKELHAEAIQAAADGGGWVLDTDIYPGLTPGLYAVVRGPFARLEDAERRLAFAKAIGHESAYIRNAGVPSLPTDVGSDNLSPQLMALILGELDVELSQEPGGRHACEPSGPYENVTLRVGSVVLRRQFDGSIERVVRLTEADIFPAIWIISETGEIDLTRACAD